MAIVKIVPNEKGNPPGKLADAEIHFSFSADDEAALARAASGDAADPAIIAAAKMALTFKGLKLIGFVVWERRTGGGRNVTFPARQYSVNGERRSFALLRPITDATAQDRIRDLILEAYAESEQPV